MSFWVAGAVVVGSAIQSDAAGKAADAQAEGLDAATAEQREGRLAFEERIDPFVNIGADASGELSRFLGLDAGPGQISRFESELQTAQDELTNLQLDLQGQKARGGSKGRKRALALQEPIRKAQLRADRAQAELDGALAGGGTQNQLAGGFTPSQTQQLEEINPVLSFLREQGFESIQESAAAGGRLGAGGTLKDLTQFNTDLTSTIVPQLQNQRFNQLFNVASQGQNAAVGAGTAALNTATNIGNLQAAAGQAQAGGIIGQSNALTGGIQSLTGTAGAFPNLFRTSTPLPPQPPAGSGSGGGGAANLIAF